MHGFISVPKNLLLDLIQTPEVQRLRRIRQLGLGHLVFPGAEHTRFGHALGAMALMQDTLSNMSEKGTPVSAEEQTAAMAAALLHDIGHAPFSHTLEHAFFSDFHHEDMSRVLIADLNERFGGALDLAIRIFDGTYERRFFHQLVSSQLDMDRLDYLRRDSFYTGVVEGTVGVERIIKTLRVNPLDGGPKSEVVVEAKGVYAVENYLISRRLMYWQVYLHKTVLAADQLLRSIFRRARALLEQGHAEVETLASPELMFFLRERFGGEDIAKPDVRKAFVRLDDTDVIYSIKRWQQIDDAALADLSRRFVDRDFFRVTFLPSPPNDSACGELMQRTGAWLREAGMDVENGDVVSLYAGLSNTSHSAYEHLEDSILMMDREDRVRELSQMSDTATISALTHFVEKSFVFAPKEVALPEEMQASL